MNIGATHYQMRNSEEAEKAFAQAALTGDNLLKERAFYDLGNVAYRKGELLKAVEYYQSALDLNPDDEDAKFNIEFTRDEIRRRAEEAKKRQEQQQQQQQQGQQQQDQQQQGEQQEQQAQPQDSDKDGLSDEGEKSAKNPTDPQNPDTDGDGLKDGEEDKNQNGQVDAGETDPNKKDSDGDGVSDADEAKQEQAQPAEGQQGDNQKNLTQEQALRTLQALEEGKPGDKNPKRVRGSGRPVKDW
jgi:Ca-activated chloride channel family protein